MTTTAAAVSGAGSSSGVTTSGQGYMNAVKKAALAVFSVVASVQPSILILATKVSRFTCRADHVDFFFSSFP